MAADPDSTFVQSDLRMDRGSPLGNSMGTDNRRQLHVKAFPFGAPLPSTEYDAITCVQLDPLTVRFEFRAGGIAGAVVQNIDIAYTTPTNIPFSSVVYS